MDIKTLIAQGEGEQLDFKHTIKDARKISIALTAFANTKGGKLLIGVKDNGTIKGCDPNEEIFMLESALDRYCKPQPKVTFEPLRVEGKTILKVVIEAGPEQPYFTLLENNKWFAYIRTEDNCVKASLLQLNLMRAEKKNWEPKIQVGAKEKWLLEYLDQNEKITFREFCKKTKLHPKKANYILINMILMKVVKVFNEGQKEFLGLVG